VLRLLARGLSNSELANELVLSEATIKTQVARILAKLRLHDRVQAVVLAFQSGLANPDQPRTESRFRDTCHRRSARERR
jgi:DNA-binding NarL/FixJ family response regulator